MAEVNSLRAYREEGLRGVVLVEVHELLEVEVLSAANRCEDVVQVKFDLLLALYTVFELIEAATILSELALLTSACFPCGGGGRH